MVLVSPADLSGDCSDEVGQRYSVGLVARTVADRDVVVRRLLIADDQHVGRLHLAVRADLLADGRVAVVDLDPDSVVPQLGGDLLGVVDVLLGDGEDVRLCRGEPGGELSCEGTIGGAVASFGSGDVEACLAKLGEADTQMEGLRRRI